MGRIYPSEANGRKDLPEFKLYLPDSLGNGVHLPQRQAQADLARQMNRRIRSDPKAGWLAVQGLRSCQVVENGLITTASSPYSCYDFGRNQNCLEGCNRYRRGPIGGLME